MDNELERSIRGKILDLQIFLSSGDVTTQKLVEINEKFDCVLKIMNPKMGEPKCEA